jgi:hypothetical protein
LKLATTTAVLAFALQSSLASADDAARTPQTAHFSAGTAVAAQLQSTRPFASFRARSLEFGQGPQLFPQSGSLAHASRGASTVFATIDVASLARNEPRWKAKDTLLTGVPPHDEESHLGEAVARGVLGVVIGRAVGELVSAQQPRRTQVKVRSASDPHGKGLGLKLSASW